MEMEIEGESDCDDNTPYLLWELSDPLRWKITRREEASDTSIMIYTV